MLRLAPSAMAACLCVALPGQFFGERVRNVFEPELLGFIAATLDVDGDGDQDILTSEGTTGHIYLNDGYGRFTWLNSFAGDWNAQGDLNPAIGDLDNDGDLEFCVGTKAFTNQGGGAFTTLYSFPASLAQNISRLLDYDNDGDLDYLVYIFTLGTNGAQLFENNGSGQFTNVTATAFAGLNLYAGSLDVGDVDGDGDTDVLVGSGGLSNLTMRVWLNQSGVFTSVAIPSPAYFSVGASIHLQDINNDTHPDVTVAAFFEPTWVALNDGTGMFTPATTTGLATSSSTTNRVIADWNGDGVADYITAEGAYVQTQPLQFELQPFEGATIAGQLWASDLDGDQDLDVACAGSAVVLNTRDGGISAYVEPEPPGLAHIFVNTPLDSRAFGGANPTSQVLWRRGQQPLFFTDATPTANDPDRQLRPVPLPTIDAVDGAIVHNSVPSAATGVVITTDTTASYFELGSAGFSAVAALPTIAGESTVAAAQLDDVPGDELVFGNEDHDGPRVFVRMPSGFVEFSPTLPPPPPASSGAFESIVLADMDGDGDCDIVHEHRVLLNEGGCVWSAGPSFDQLAPASTTSIRSIDFDADGDRDLILSGIGLPPVLLQNTGSSFVDVTATTIPASLTTGALLLTVGDVDLDGLEDILACNTQTDLLRNVGGSFVHEPDAAEFGALVDTNHDGRADVFDGIFVQAGLHTHLHAPFLATPGTPWQLDLETWRVGVTAQVAFVGIGTEEQFVHYPGIGRLYLAGEFADVISMPIVAGAAQRLLALPTQPTLLGTTLTAQAIVVDDERLQLTNAVRGRIR